ncbi:UNVERIFIED_CONTAM: Ribose-phosphate pyrophosphokinase, mitochondrial [Sesamum radiatum]|uniref:ribose-phosphate diphosphokinase n=1 Tax=Sesamum radiatum TaxID=300843 RepID=A0AAW2TUF6_SESRA
MSAIPPSQPLPSSSSKTPNKSRNPIFRTRIQCELKNSSPPPQKWTIDCVSSTDPIHIILKPPNSAPMALPLDSSLKNSKRICLFYCSEMKDLAERIAAESDAIELRSISWRTFEDGFPNLFISNAQGVRGQHVAFLASFSSPGVIFEQLSVIYALPKLFVSSFTLVLPFFPTGTSERMEDEGDVATAFTLARILSNIPISRGGPTSLVIFDIHALQERFYFGDNILPCFESGIPLLLQRLQQLPDSDNITIAFPDDGAWKRFHKQLQHFPMIVCAKVREGDQRIVRLKEGEPKRRHVVIVDDLVQSGGTLLECQKVLAKHGAAKISAYVTHGIFPNKSWERFKHDKGGNPENGMTYFWITDSCPATVKQVKQKAPFEILSLAAAIASALQI